MNSESKLQPIDLKNKDLIIFHNPGSYINCNRMYFGYFNKIPNIISIEDINTKLYENWFEKEYCNKIIKHHYQKEFLINSNKFEYTDNIFLLENEIVVNIEDSNVYLLFSEEQCDIVTSILNSLKKFKIKSKKTTDISLIYSLNGELDTKELNIKKPKIDFDIHYNEGFQPIHQEIVKQLNKKDSNGLYLFHGQPGTGKSTYIKYLIHQLKKKVIFISPKMAGELDNLSMTPFLLDNKNTVFVIEDAEELISSREEVRNSNLSMLLNLTDGLLGESLGIQIIATFNTDVKNIDKALLRKGRLSTIYEFKNLTLDRTNSLLQKLGHTIEVDNPLPVAEIFNFDKDNHYIPKLQKAVGFGN